MSLRILLDVLSPRARAVNQRRAPRRLRLEPLDDRSLPSGYVQANLASDVPGQAVILDPQLVNAWGMTANSAPTGAWWISCEGTGLSTLYTGDVTQANGTVTPFVKGTLTVTLPGGSPTGQVFNAPAPIPAAEDFFVSAANSNGVVSTAPSRFITVSNTGHITGWAASVPPPPPAPPSRNAQLVGTTEGAVYTGLAIATVGTSDFLYAADFRNGRIDVFDNKFAPTTSLAGDFVDPNIPAGYLPYNIQNLENKLYVTYARQVDGDPEPDKGRGFISVFDTSGNFLNRLVSRGKLREPWGMAIAPSNFGELSNALLVANHRDGRINAYDPETGKFIDRLRDADDRPIKIDGLHGLHFGNGKSAGDLNALYFTAGPDDGAHGLMGSLRVAPEAAAAAEKGSKAMAPSVNAGAPTLVSAPSENKTGGTTATAGSVAAAPAAVDNTEPAPSGESVAGDSPAMTVDTSLMTLEGMSAGLTLDGGGGF